MAQHGLIAMERLRTIPRTEPLIAVPVDAGLVGDDVVADWVAREAGTVVIDLDRGTLDSQAVRLIPRELAEKHLVIAVADEADERIIRAAFADPLDGAAISKLTRTTGRSVRPLVATVSAIRRAIEREYGSGTPEISEESTRRLDAIRAPTEESSATNPSFRVAESASAEQRVEALVLALVERGVITHADYGDALDRLLKSRRLE